jgi:hypothetical protein
LESYKKTSTSNNFNVSRIVAIWHRYSDPNNESPNITVLFRLIRVYSNQQESGQLRQEDNRQISQSSCSCSLKKAENAKREKLQPCAGPAQG